MKEQTYNWDFFGSLQELFSSVKHPSLFGAGNWENCDYADGGWYSKNVYLSFIFGWESENVMYTRNTKFSSHIYNSTAIWSSCEFVHQSTFITNSYQVFYSRWVEGSKNIWFSSNMIGCEECFWCNNQTNKKYMIFDKQCTPEEYEREKKRLLSDKDQFDALYKKVSWNKVTNPHAENVTNAHVACSVKDARNLLYSWWSTVRTNYYDVLAWGAWNHMYGVYQWVYFSDHIYCSAHINWSMNIFYSYNLRECTLWKFLPSTMNPFYFNDTVASLIDGTFTKEEVETAWYLRRDEEIKVDIPEWMDVVSSNDLNQFESLTAEWEREIDPSILKKVIQDTDWNYYRIMPMEYKFLKKYWLPLPRKHWLSRLKDNFIIGNNS